MFTTDCNPAILKQKFSLMSENDFIASALELKTIVLASPDISPGHYHNLALFNLLQWCRIFYVKTWRGQKKESK